ncbi:MAG: hypothetical protein P8Y07_12090 [Gemmatimonadales bacterium]|jgi:hypothetical protein
MMNEILAVLAFAALFALFGVLRLRAGCSGDPAGCGRCGEICTKEPRNDRGREQPDPSLEVHR